MNDWQVETLRLTVFKVELNDPIVPRWENLTREKPIAIDAQPRMNTLREQGPISFGTLVHQSNPMRIDWYLIPSQEPQQNDVALPLLGPFAQVMAHFFSLISQWISSEDIPKIKRIALGSTLLLPADTKVSAYKQLASFLPHVKIDIENSYDFQYQINRPTKSITEADLQINRLSKWSAIRSRGVIFLFDTKPEVIKDTKEHFSCKLELDINTSQYHDKPFLKTQLPQILHELREMSERIAAEGDK